MIVKKGGYGGGHGGYGGTNVYLKKITFSNHYKKLISGYGYGK